MKRWAEIDEFPGYFISDEGQVWSNKTTRLLKLSTDKDGYQIATLYRDGRYKKCKVHRLVVQAFIGGDIENLQVNHKDEDPSNNKVENLEICDASYNINYGTRNAQVANKLMKRPPTQNKPVEAVDSEGNVKLSFPSLHAAERAGFNRAAVGRMCAGYPDRRSYYGYIWRYAISNTTTSPMTTC